MGRLANACLPILLLVLGACDESDAVSLRIKVREDFSGTIRASSLVLPAADGLVQRETQGATWDSRVDVACAAGRFDGLSALKLSDLAISGGEAGEGLCFVRVVLPRGEAARWPRAFVPLSDDGRARVAGAIDPTGKAKTVGSTIKIEIELPATVVGNGLTGKSRGMKATAEGSVATLVVPLEQATTPGEPITWHLTWQK